ncbi:MAG: hypothetical protein ABFD92_01430 [Planctomycetaceae bacterium]|nr:hypothetical protein [Planctomycetaceae bacterium]
MISTSLAAWAVVIAAAAGAAPSPATSRPASGPAAAAPKVTAPEVQAIITQLKATDQPGEAAGLFMRGRTLDRNNLDLCRAYMRKMLTLGYPRVAYHGAYEVVRLDSGDGTAWATMAYYLAREGKFALAIDPAVRAAALLNNDASALSNLGQLMGWSDELKHTASLSAKAAGMFKENEKAWTSAGAYSGAYKAARSKMKTYNDAMKKSTAAVDEADKQEKEALTVIRNGTIFVRNARQRVAEWTEENKKNQTHLDLMNRSGGSGNYKRDLEARINNTKNGINTLNGQIGQATNKVNEAVRTVAKARDNAAKAKADAAKLSMPELEWKVPSVDGRATADAEDKGKRFTLMPAAPAPAPADTGDLPPVEPPAATTRPTASEAQSALDLAKMLLQNNRVDKGLQSLREIVLRYPNTAVAKEAQELLKQHENP